MKFLYNIGINAYYWLLKIAANFNPKAKQWVEGRQQLVQQLEQLPKDERRIWFHCASLGEFEQGRPIIEACKTLFPTHKIVLTFFSPSGYEIRKNYPLADYIFYMPIDLPKPAQQFVQYVNPEMAIFIKYEFWANHLLELKQRQIPTLLISAIFDDHHVFFKWYGAWWRQLLDIFEMIFVQNQSSAHQLDSIGFKKYIIAGDTRIDSVLKRKESTLTFPLIEQFIQEKLTLIVGSSWPEDEAILIPFIQEKLPSNWKVIIAPHDISARHLQQLQKLLQAANISFDCYSYQHPRPDAVVLIIDNIGMLSALYQYGHIAYIGGGFGSGIHNTLEPIVFELPVLFGQKYKRFEEAVQLVDTKGGFVVHQLTDIITHFDYLQNSQNYQQASQAAYSYIQNNQGASKQIIAYLRNHAKLQQIGLNH